MGKNTDHATVSVGYVERLAEAAEAAVPELAEGDVRTALRQAAEAARDGIKWARERAESEDHPSEYWGAVESIAEEAHAQYPDPDDSDRHDYIWESIDGSYWVIYTHAAKRVLEYTDNDPDLSECWHMAGDSRETTFERLYTVAAFEAMRADVHDKLSALDDALREAIEEAESDCDNALCGDGDRLVIRTLAEASTWLVAYRVTDSGVTRAVIDGDGDLESPHSYALAEGDPESIESLDVAQAFGIIRALYGFNGSDPEGERVPALPVAAATEAE